MNGTNYSFDDCFVSMITKPFAQRFVIIPWWVKAHFNKKIKPPKKPDRAGSRF